MHKNDIIEKIILDLVSLSEEIDKQDVLKMDIPLFIRILEYVKENNLEDNEIHKLTEELIKIQKNGVAVLGIDNFSSYLKEEVNPLKIYYIGEGVYVKTKADLEPENATLIEYNNKEEIEKANEYFRKK